MLGRYVLEPEIFAHLRTIPRGAGGEIQLTDAIARLVPARNDVRVPLQGQRFDCGSKEGFLDGNRALRAQGRLRAVAPLSVALVVLGSAARARSRYSRNGMKNSAK